MGSAPKSNAMLLLRHTHPAKDLIRLYRQLLELSAKYAEFLVSRDGGNSFKNSWTQVQIRTSAILTSLCKDIFVVKYS